MQQNITRFNELLKEGERICGEWLAMCIGTKYNLTHEPFVPFDIISGKNRLNYYDFADRVLKLDFTLPRALSIGEPMSIAKAIEAIAVSGHGAIDPVEGAIWRVERKGEVDFLCKFVHHFKQDGKYMDQDIWHWKPGQDRY